jgi:hypothetical protein
MFSNLFPKIVPFIRLCGKIRYSQIGQFIPAEVTERNHVGDPGTGGEKSIKKKSYRYAVVVRSGFALNQDRMRQVASVMLCNVNQQMHTFQINVLIQFLVSSTFFEHHCSSSGRPFVHAVFMVCFPCIYVGSLAVGSLCSIQCNKQGNRGLAWFRNGDLRIGGGVKLCGSVSFRPM